MRGTNPFAPIQSSREAANIGAAQAFSVSPALDIQAGHDISQSRLLWRVPEDASEIANGTPRANGGRAGAVSLAPLRRTSGAGARGPREICRGAVARSRFRHQHHGGSERGRALSETAPWRLVAHDEPRLQRVSPRAGRS